MKAIKFWEKIPEFKPKYGLSHARSKTYEFSEALTSMGSTGPEVVICIHREYMNILIPIITLTGDITDDILAIFKFVTEHMPTFMDCDVDYPELVVPYGDSFITGILCTCETKVSHTINAVGGVKLSISDFMAILKRYYIGRRTSTSVTHIWDNIALTIAPQLVDGKQEKILLNDDEYRDIATQHREHDEWMISARRYFKKLKYHNCDKSTLRYDAVRLINADSAKRKTQSVYVIVYDNFVHVIIPTGVEVLHAMGKQDLTFTSNRRYCKHWGIHDFQLFEFDYAMDYRDKNRIYYRNFMSPDIRGIYRFPLRTFVSMIQLTDFKLQCIDCIMHFIYLINGIETGMPRFDKNKEKQK